jgi:hypothetical protein
VCVPGTDETTVGKKSYVGCRHVDGDMKSKKQEELGKEERLSIDECLERSKSLP